MAVYRTVHTSFWTDSKVSESMTPEDKFFMLYILTNPLTNTLGCYEISKRVMSYDTGYNIDTIEKLIDRFVNIHKLIRYDSQNRELLIENWSKYNWLASDKTLTRIVAELQQLKSDTFQQLLIDRLGKFYKKDIKSMFKTDGASMGHGRGSYAEQEHNKNINNNKNKTLKDSVPDSSSVTVKKFVKPTLNQIKDYQTEYGSNVSVEEFYDYFESKGWLVGKSPMKDWKSAFRNWVRKGDSFKSSKPNHETTKKRGLSDATAI